MHCRSLFMPALIMVSVSVAVAAEPKKSGKPSRVRASVKVTPPPKPVKPDHRMKCQIGPYEKQTRFVMETAKGKPVYIAYWSSDGPYRCSFESRPQDGYAQWLEASVGTVIRLISGTVLIEEKRGVYTVTARDIDRMTYCGTDGLINGVLTVPRKGGECRWEETTSAEAAQLNTPDNTPSPR